MSDINALEASIAARQQRLGGTVDELASRLTPEALLERNKQVVKSKVASFAMTDNGDLRVERVAAAAAVVVVLLALRVWGGRRRKARRG